MQVSICTPCRLHFGLIDLNGKLKRVDGGVGVALSTPCVDLTIKTTNNKELFIQPEIPIVRDLIHRFYEKIVRKNIPGLQIKLHSTIPSHVGLGSKTQISLALATALSRIERKEISIRDLAYRMGRGGTSGIGTTAFEKGGFILDGGHSFGPTLQKSNFLPSRASQAHPPPVLFQMDFPSEWRFVLALPPVEEGAHGSREIDMFKKFCPIPDKDVEGVCRIILMKLLPGVVERNCVGVGEALNQLQTIGFKKIEINLQSPLIPELMKLAVEGGADGSGMSSFGPVVYSLTDSETKARNIVQIWEEKLRLNSEKPGKVWISPVRNTGATIT
ncbi:MAG: beta-ribofuranosylaminobenzene 5'-phosphate synthase [Promethearchaeota archaeon]